MFVAQLVTGYSEETLRLQTLTGAQHCHAVGSSILEPRILPQEISAIKMRCIVY